MQRLREEQAQLEAELLQATESEEEDGQGASSKPPPLPPPLPPEAGRDRVETVSLSPDQPKPEQAGPAKAMPPEPGSPSSPQIPSPLSTNADLPKGDLFVVAAVESDRRLFARTLNASKKDGKISPKQWLKDLGAAPSQDRQGMRLEVFPDNKMKFEAQGDGTFTILCPHSQRYLYHTGT